MRWDFTPAVAALKTGDEKLIGPQLRNQCPANGLLVSRSRLRCIKRRKPIRNRSRPTSGLGIQLRKRKRLGMDVRILSGTAHAILLIELRDLSLHWPYDRVVQRERSQRLVVDLRCAKWIIRIAGLIHAKRRPSDRPFSHGSKEI